MRKPKNWAASRGSHFPRGEAEKLDEALMELRRYGQRKGSWDVASDSYASNAIKKSVSYFLWHWDTEQLTPPPHFVRSQLRQLIKAARAIESLHEESHWTARCLVEAKLAGTSNPLSEILNQTRRMVEALENTAAGECKIWDPGLPTAKLRLLQVCLLIMEITCSVRPGLTKYNHINGGGPLLRFTRPVFEYATGLRAADGAFDNEVKILRDLYPRRVPYAEGVNRLTHVKEKNHGVLVHDLTPDTRAENLSHKCLRLGP
jgi:hypothetical protein